MRIKELAGRYRKWFLEYINNFALHILFLSNLSFLIWPVGWVGLTALYTILVTISFPLVIAIIASFVCDCDFKKPPGPISEVKTEMKKFSLGIIKGLPGIIAYILIITILTSIIAVFLEVYFSISFDPGGPIIFALMWVLVFGHLEIIFWWKFLKKDNSKLKEKAQAI